MFLKEVVYLYFEKSEKPQELDLADFIKDVSYYNTNRALYHLRCNGKGKVCK